MLMVMPWLRDFPTDRDILPIEPPGAHHFPRTAFTFNFKFKYNLHRSQFPLYIWGLCSRANIAAIWQYRHLNSQPSVQYSNSFNTDLTNRGKFLHFHDAVIPRQQYFIYVCHWLQPSHSICVFLELAWRPSLDTPVTSNHSGHPASTCLPLMVPRAWTSPLLGPW